MDTTIDLDDSLDEAAFNISINVAEHLRDVWRLKRFTQFGVYTAIFLSEPLYIFVLKQSMTEILVGLAVGLVIATTAIEAAFAQMFKLRKRSAYPGALSLQLGALPRFDMACHGAVTSMTNLLSARGAFLALEDDKGYLSLAALDRIGRIDAERYLRLGATCVRHSLDNKTVVSLRSDGIGDEAVLPPGHQLVFVTVRSFQGVIGVMGILADRPNRDLRDSELLAALGYAIGVSLESLRQRDELRSMASMDDLTRVYNRRYFFEQLDRELAAARRYSIPLSVAIVDLDGLKRLNDGFGHDVGDAALRTLAQRLVRYARTSDTVARLGGDEFAVILPRTDNKVAAQVVRRLYESIEAEDTAVGNGCPVRLSVSCGFASFPDDAGDAEQVLRQADVRMYAAKVARRKNRES